MMLGHDLKIAWRNLVNNKFRSVVSVAGIVAGFVAFIFGGYWWHWENRFDTFHPANERLCAIVTYGLTQSADNREAAINQLHKDDAADFVKSVPEIERMCPVGEAWFMLEEESGIRYYSALRVDSVFFRLFWHRFLDGGNQGVAPNGESVFLTRKMAIRWFGTIHCSGKEISMGKDRTGKDQIFRVAGVIEDYPANSELLFDFLIYGTPSCNVRDRAATYVLLKENVDLERVRQKIATHKSVAVDPFGIDVPSRWRFELCSLPDVHMSCHPELGNRFRNIRILAFAGLLALISALMNHLVLFIGQQQSKEREYITRVSLGSSLARMMGKMLAELLLPLLLAFGIALCCIELLFPFYRDFTEIRLDGMNAGFVHQMSREYLLGGLLRYMVIVGGCFGGAGMLPVYFICRQQHNKLINREYSVQVPVLFRRILIVGQIFIGTIFFISSLGLFRQLYFLTHADPGIDIRNVAQIDLGFRTSAVIDKEQLRGELKNSPYVTEVTMTNEPVLSSHGIYYGNRVGFIPVEGRSFKKYKAEGKEDYIFNIEENFFHFFRIRLLEGTLITEENPCDVVVNETGCRELGFPDLLQRSLENQGKVSRKVAGVIRDYHYAPLQYPVRTVFFEVNRGEDPYNVPHCMYVRYLPEHRKEALHAIREVMRRYDREEVGPEQQITELEEVIDEFNRPEKVIFVLFSTLAALCVLISSFGIYCLVALSAEQRRKEIAIRKVNGATFRDILGLFLKEYIYLTMIGAVMALLAGYRLIQWWLETYAYRTDMNAGLFVVATGVVGLIVLGTVALQVRKALRSDPARALKQA